MRRGRLPLTALRTFEVAGRHRSFTRAAEELHISQAAVSRQVRELEVMVGQALFERRHRSVHLTTAGDELLAVLTRSFDEIGDSLDHMRSRAASSTLVISSEPSFATGWLVPHLAEFGQEHPDIDVEIDADPRIIELRSHEASIAIRHSSTATQWPRVESRHLYDVRIMPLMSPQLLDAWRPLTEPADLLGHVLLHEERRDIWQRWFAAAGVDVSSSDMQRGVVYTDGGLTLQAALRGQGVALVDERFGTEAVAEGRLVCPFPLSIPYGAYWLVARHFERLPRAAASFEEWIGRYFRSGRK